MGEVVDVFRGAREVDEFRCRGDFRIGCEAREPPRLYSPLPEGDPMKLVGSKTSPYVRKARVIVAEKQLAFEWVPENVWDAATRIGDFNPLGKVPALVTDDGDYLYDPPVI